MKHRREGALFTTSLLFAAACFALAIPGLTPVGRMVPVWVVVPTLFLLGVQLHADLRMPAAARRAPVAPASRRAGFRREHRAMAWTGALFLLVILAGIPLASAVYVYLFLRRECGAHARVTLPLAVATALLAYGAIVVVLGKPLWSGSIW